MRFYVPTEVYNTQNCVERYATKLASFGKKALIVTGRNSAKKCGALDDVIKALESNDTAYEIFDEVENNPSMETVMKARDFGLKSNVDFVIGIGGGSPLDACKAISMMIKNKDKGMEMLYDADYETTYLPTVCIPTTAGTGSEVTPYAILTVHKDKTKRSLPHKIYPVLALTDSKYTRFMSHENTVNTAIDALAHMLESNLNTNANLYNRAFSEYGLKVWGVSKDSLINASLEEKDFNNFLNASTIAGMAIAHTGTSLPHGLSYTLTYELNIPHGKAVGIFLPGYLKEYAKNDSQAVKECLNNLDFKDIDEFKNYIDTVLGKVSFDQTLLEQDVERIMANEKKLKNYPFKITAEELIDFYEV